MARPRRPQRRTRTKRPERFVTLSEQLMLASFACACGAEIEIAPEARLTSEIVCAGCGERIGVYAELLPAPARASRRRR
jgi:hypothetical protein